MRIDPTCPWLYQIAPKSIVYEMKKNKLYWKMLESIGDSSIFSFSIGPVLSYLFKVQQKRFNPSLSWDDIGSEM